LYKYGAIKLANTYKNLYRKIIKGISDRTLYKRTEMQGSAVLLGSVKHNATLQPLQVLSKLLCRKS